MFLMSLKPKDSDTINTVNKGVQGLAPRMVYVPTTVSLSTTEYLLELMRSKSSIMVIFETSQIFLNHRFSFIHHSISILFILLIHFLRSSSFIRSPFSIFSATNNLIRTLSQYCYYPHAQTPSSKNLSI